MPYIIKKCTSILIVIFTCIITIHAQTIEDNKLLIPNYNGSAAIIIESNNKIKIQKADQVINIPVKETNKHLSFLTDQDKIKAIALLGLQDFTLPLTYQKKYEQDDAITALINIANEHISQKLIIENNETIPVNPESEELIQATQPDTSASKPDYTLPIIIGIGGIIAGFIIGWLSKKTKVITNTVEKEIYINTPVTPAIEKKPRKTKATSNDEQLNALNTKLEEQLETIQQLKLAETKLNAQLKQALQFDELYYEKVFNEIILPMQKAINIGDVTQIFKYIMLAGIQLQSIARYKTNKKLKYDEQNIAIILQSAYDIQEYPVITKNTPQDQTPKNLQTVISILKQLGIKDLTPYVFQGYIIKELND